MEKSTLILWLITIILWGICPIIEKIGLKNVDPLMALFVRTLVALIGLSLAVFLTGTFKPEVLNFKNIAVLSLSGILGGFLGMLTYFTLLKSQKASQIVPLTSVYPLIATFFSVIFLKEEIHLNKIIAVFLIVSGVFLLFKNP
ncbi:EamA family transporter [Thermodesulfobacterium sp. TA1]|uniref:EamA family transporter n=1 Tax=Thermodesulfobacterium sp. TA1 TaxID=2234087 RepID=UPI00123210BF|nr:EamA family transporter [Thermodesulfobacterium sp. TA1]QER41772.1 EamA family transporter [Thermodesulfobacterium sp. TA1]